MRCISVRAMGKATIMTSKAYYAIFVKGGVGGRKLSFFFFSRPLHIENKLSIQQHFPIKVLTSQTWKS